MDQTQSLNTTEMPKTPIKLGHIEKGTGEHQSNIIYSWGGVLSMHMCGDGCEATTDNVHRENRLNIVIGGMQKHQAIKTDGICTTLCSAMGTGGGYVPMVVELDMAEEIKNSLAEQSRAEQSRAEQTSSSALTEHTTDRRLSQSQIAYPQDVTVECRQCVRKETWSVNYGSIGKQIDIAMCLQARDCKGFGTSSQLQNGVIEIWV